MKQEASIPGYPEKIKQPYVSHPRLDLFVASGSKHPMERFGCTGCHLGRGRATDFVTTVHVPDNDADKQALGKGISLAQTASLGYSDVYHRHGGSILHQMPYGCCSGSGRK